MDCVEFVQMVYPLPSCWTAFSSVWFGTVLPGEFRAVAPRRRRVFSGRPVGFFTFWLALADFLLDLGLFRVVMTKVLSKMRSLETPARAGAIIGSTHYVLEEDTGAAAVQR